VSGIDLDRRLYRDWWAVLLLFGAVAAVAVERAATSLGFETASRWGVVAIAVGVAELVYLRRSLALNHPRGRPSEPYRRLGMANVVTVIRGALFAALAGFAAVRPTPSIAWLPALCYGVGVTLDLVDGRVARTVDRRTVLGEKLDMAFDTLGFLVAIGVAVLWGRLPAWYLSLGAARYVFRFGCWLRERRGLPVDELPPSKLRRYLAAVQMAFVTIALVPLLATETVHAIAPFVLAPSLAFFVRDYLVVSRQL
jgi:CDP-diacylglycerol--glycerol-3-phosphate 3-phosphatidyltransferase